MPPSPSTQKSGSSSSSSNQADLRHPLIADNEEPSTTVAANNINNYYNNSSSSNSNNTGKQPPARPGRFNSWDEADRQGDGYDNTEGEDDFEDLDDPDDDDDDDDDDIPNSSRRGGAGAWYKRVHSQDEDSTGSSGSGELVPIRRGGGGGGDAGTDYEDDEDGPGDDLEHGLLTPTAAAAGVEDYDQSDLLAKRRRSRVRKVYGGGRTLDPSSDQLAIPQRGIVSTAWLLFTSSISPAYPILVPYAYSLTGLAFGIPLTVVLLILGGSFSHLILTVEARYVGARSYPTLASYVFPQMYGIKYLGRILVDAFTAFLCMGRVLLGVYIAGDLFIHLFSYLFPRASILHSRHFVTLVIGLSYLLPALLVIGNNPKRRCGSRSANNAMTFLNQLPYASVLLYPIILLIVGVSLKNLEDYPSLLRPGHPKLPPSKELLHTPTLWSGVSILMLLTTSNHAYTFSYYRSLKRKSKDQANARSSSSEASLSASKGISYRTAAEPSTIDKLLTRHRWEVATMLASALTALYYISFGLVGYLSLLKIQPNLFESLPKDHDWFNFARVLLLFTVLPLLHENVRPAKIAIAGLLSIPRRLARISSPSRSRSSSISRPLRRGRGASQRQNRRRSSSVLDLSDGEDEELQEEDFDLTYSYDSTAFASIPVSPSMQALMAKIPKAKQWEYRLAMLILWASVIACACTIRDLGAIEEVLGSIGATGLGMILPSVFFIALFHVRRPRSILSSPSNIASSGAGSSGSHDPSTDVLLLNKERQLQRKLMGKRIWMDLGTFGLLLPVGVVGMGRGIWAFATG